MTSSNSSTLKGYLHDIADSIRFKRAKSDLIPMVDMADEIMDIEFDSFVTFDDHVTHGSKATVSVPAIDLPDMSQNITADVNIVQGG